MSRLIRTPQLRAEFSPGEPGAGFYNDLRGVALDYGTPDEAIGWLDLFAHRRQHAWPVSIVQLGLGAWQLATQGAPADGGGTDHGAVVDVEGWTRVVRAVANWAAVDMDARGILAHLQPMPHTYSIDPPWASAMAQGEAASLLVRAADLLGVDAYRADARRAIASLLPDPDMEPGDVRGLVAMTDEGPVLQEYPSSPPAHVLNGWIWALWGLYDVASSGEGDREAREAFDQGVETLIARLPRYDTGNGWSRYDLFPHPLTNVASPFYHRLHIEQLRALHQLVPDPALAAAADRWEAGLARPLVRVGAVARKVGFRLVRPKRKVA